MRGGLQEGRLLGLKAEPALCPCSEQLAASQK